MSDKLIRFIDLRDQLERVFCVETALSGCWNDNIPSSGHCAAVALLVQRRFGGELLSAIVDGKSHWFNRIDGYDVDLTGDQFGFSTFRIKPCNMLYENTRVRSVSEASEETVARSALLEKKLNELRDAKL